MSTRLAPTEKRTALEAASVLEDAAACLVQHGWVQGANLDAAGRLCAGGAILQAANGPSSKPRSLREVDRLAGMAYAAFNEWLLSEHPGTVSIVAWNDHADRTGTQVLDGFAAAAAYCRERQP